MIFQSSSFIGRQPQDSAAYGQGVALIAVITACCSVAHCCSWLVLVPPIKWATADSLTKSLSVSSCMNTYTLTYTHYIQQPTDYSMLHHSAVDLHPYSSSPPLLRTVVPQSYHTFFSLSDGIRDDEATRTRLSIVQCVCCECTHTPPGIST